MIRGRGWRGLLFLAAPSQKSVGPHSAMKRSLIQKLAVPPAQIRPKTSPSAETE